MDVNKWSKATPQEKANEILRRWEELKIKREPFFNQWKEISSFISPYSGRFDVHNHSENRSSHLILDGEAGHDLNILSSGLMSGASSPSRPFFKITPNDPSLNDNYEVLMYCEYVQQLLLKVFSKSNTYNTLHSMYKELALFGISADIVYDDIDSAIRHHLLTAGEFCVETDHNGEIDTLYRNFELTTMQAIKTFGYENCPKEIQVCYDRGDLQAYFEFIHAIEPRLDRDYKSITNENYQWSSMYICLGANDRAFVMRESGFNYFPVICPRWDVIGLDAYGTSPSMVCLPDIKQLQAETLRKEELIENYTKPPLQAPNNARQQPISLNPGSINFTQSTGSDNAIRPIIQSVGDLNAITQDINGIKEAIRRAYFVDLFMMVKQTAGDRRTTVEIYALQQEQMLSLGSVVERTQNECLGKLVGIAYRKLVDMKMLPPPPSSMGNSQLNVEFTSILAQSQKSVDINAVDRFFSALASASQVAPEILDRIDADGYVDEYRDRLGVAPKILRSKEEAEKIRQERQQAQAQAQAMQQAQQQSLTDMQMAQAQRSGAETSLAMQQLESVGGGSVI